MDLSIINPRDIADGLVNLLDGVLQAEERLKKTKLENKAREQALEIAEKKADHEEQMDLLDQEIQGLELQRQELELLIKRLEALDKGLEITMKLVDSAYPVTDEETRAILIRKILHVLGLLNTGFAGYLSSDR